MPDYMFKINLMIFIEELDENFDALKKPLDSCSKCMNLFLNDESLLSFYAYVLAIGNYINTVFI